MLELLRLKQWIKNLFVFAALVYAQKFLEWQSVLKVLLTFVLFCLLASGTYIINDLFDLKADREHPVKKNRPLPSGKISIKNASFLAALLSAGAILGGFAVNQFVGVSLLTYFVLFFCYSSFFKHIVILDVIVVALGFVIRVVAGAAAIMVPVSPWIIITTLLLALFLALAKRRHELMIKAGSPKHRRVLEEYSHSFLDQMIAVVATSTIVTYVLYTMWPETIRHSGTDKLILTTPFVLYGIFRYQYLVYKKEEGGNPTQLMITDIPLIVCVLLWIVTTIVIFSF